jgi:hypothetical protein
MTEDTNIPSNLLIDDDIDAEWRARLRANGFALNGEGQAGFVAGTDVAGTDDVVLVVAAPRGCDVVLGAGHSCWLLAGDGMPAACVIGMAQTFTDHDNKVSGAAVGFDLGDPQSRVMMTTLAQQEGTRVAIIDPFTGRIVDRSTMWAPEQNAFIASALALSVGARPANAGRRQHASLCHRSSE